jgi:hypothetical protein
MQQMYPWGTFDGGSHRASVEGNGPKSVATRERNLKAMAEGGEKPFLGVPLLSSLITYLFDTLNYMKSLTFVSTGL